MFDTMTLTKAGGAFCGALLVFLLGKWAAEIVYATEAGGHGEEHAQAYVIETDEDEGGAAEEEEGPDFATLLASADVDSGARVFGKCKACHKIDGSNATGPYLDGVVGRAVGGVDGYSYSGALVEVAETWTPENLNAFIEDPKGFAPGTKMSFAGIRKAGDRADLVAYLQSISE
ncbi:Cytochrome cy [Pseudooceanicola batsensis HTCC2597]|uniref:Cytochrome cy n=1 Tax=Pseudooceanicola batsensis (strain ATCC BAA-863 / DSM 15984 / KCTC 12145 / HTCC2597) TaxID=252305 RepID=A3TVM5_PSEBH|nr:c-type cytochrome [Pseudooceanicola batsensis]EAQ03671.1 Cytochrome cy [Pseudooceanicola batsensis HTCC2597]